MGHKSAHGAPGGGDSDCPGASGARGRWSAWTDRQPTASASGSGAGGTEGGVQAPTRAGASCAQVGEAEVQPRGRRSIIPRVTDVINSISYYPRITKEFYISKKSFET